MGKNISKCSRQAILLILSFANVSFAQVPQVQHAIIVLEENTDYADVCGPNNTSMPFLCSLKNQGSFSSNYYSPTHPSIGNYDDLGWGVVTTNDDGCTPNNCGFPYSADNIVRALEAAGKTWKGYAESLPSTCYFGGDSGQYAVRHSPIPYISDVQANCLSRYVAFEDANLGFARDLAHDTLPNYAFITPNLCDDAHDCTLPGSPIPDQWLQSNVLQPLLTSGHLNPTTGDTVVIVTFDESNSDNTNGGGQVYWFMIGKGVKQNYQSTGPSTSPGFYSHESTLRLMAELLGTSFSGLGGAASAPDMAEFFGSSGPPPVSVTIAPASATVSSGGTQQFSATVTNTTNQAVTWTATAGTISAAGLFTAPVVSTNTTVTVTATSVADPSKSASARVTVQPSASVSVTIAPASATVFSGGTQQFTATVANTTNQAVTWTATAGTVSAAGLFTAPVVSTNTTVSVTATSVADPSKSASARVTVQPSGPPPQSQTVQHNSGFTPSANSVAVPFKSNVTAGDVLLVAQSTFDGETLGAPADSQGNVFTLLVAGDSPGNSVAAIYVATAKSTGTDTVTCRIGAGASDNIHCHIYEVHGVTAAADAIGTALQTATSLSASTSKATTNAGDYVFAYFGADNSEPNYTAGTGWVDTELSDSPSNDSAFSEDKIFAAAGVQTATATATVTDSFVALIVALKSSGNPPPPTGPTCVLSVSPSSGPVPLPVSAKATCTDPQNDIVSTVITWGDGTSTNGSSGTHTYANAGTFTVKVTATDSAKLTGSDTQTVIATESSGTSGPITINGQNGTVVENLHITNPNGDCVTVTNSTNITIRRSEIGPCGGNAINVSGGNTIGIYDSYIHPEKPLTTGCCDTHDGIFANGTSNLSIQGNVIAYGESNIEVNNATGVTVKGNFLLNPIDSDPSQPADAQSRGQNFQAWANSSNVTVENNYMLSSTDTSKYRFPENQEDSISFGITNGIVAKNNYITGGHSPSGCGLIADDRANSVQFLNNTLLDTGQCGIGIASGTNQVVDGNRVLNRNPVSGGGNTAIYVWNQYASTCGPVTVSNNIATEIRSDGTQSGFWNGGGCDPVTLTNDTFDAAAQALLEPPSQTMPPPLIPPEPKDCVAASPFTNNTNLPPCGGN